MGGVSTTYTTAVLLSYGTVKEFRPITPFLNLYLLNASNAENFTDEILYGKVYPVFTYSYLIMLIPVMFLTDWLKYKPIIVSEAAALVSVWGLLSWGSNLGQMQAMQACFGWASAAEVAYFSYIYAAVRPEIYQKVTSLVRGATLFGRCCGYGFGQVLVIFNISKVLKLINYISFGAVSTAFLISLFIPGIKSTKSGNNSLEIRAKKLVKSINNTRKSRGIRDKNDPLESYGSNSGANFSGKIADNDKKSINNDSQNSHKNEFRRYFTEIFRNLKQSYSDGFVLKWSIWWAFSTCLFNQVGNYIQVLWSEIGANQPGSQDYNGLTEVLNALLSALAAFFVQFLRINWASFGELSIGGLCCLQTACLAFASPACSILFVYVLYVTYCVSYQAAITVVTYNVASKLDADCHGLIFGGNAFMSLVLQTVLTIVVVDHRGFNLSVRGQFAVYAVIQGCAAAIFLIMGLITCCTRKRTKSVDILNDMGDTDKDEDTTSKTLELEPRPSSKVQLGPIKTISTAEASENT